MPTAPGLFPERDERVKAGRAKSAGTTYVTVPGVSFGTIASTTQLTLNRDYYAPAYVVSPLVLDQLVCEVTTGASGNLRMGIYSADANWQPTGAPWVDSGSIAITVALKTFTLGTALYLPRGRYLSVINVDTTSTFRQGRGVTFGSAFVEPNLGGSNAHPNSVYVARTYAAFPTPGTAWDTQVNANTGMEHYVYWRVSTP